MKTSKQQRTQNWVGGEWVGVDLEDFQYRGRYDQTENSQRRKNILIFF